MAQPQDKDNSVTRQRVWRVSLPLILSNISIPFVGIVDTAVMGHMPDAVYLGAVAAGSSIFGLLFFLMNFLRMGSGALVAQNFGQGQWQDVCDVIVRGFGLAIVLGAMVLTLQMMIVPVGLMIIGPSAETTQLAMTYMYVRVWGAPFYLVNLVVLASLIGMERSGLALVQQVTINVLNMLLNILFVIGFGYDVDGVAAATVLAEVSGTVLSLFLLSKALRAGQFRLTALIDWQAFRSMLVLNRDIFIRTFLLNMAFLAFTSLGARMGDLTFAANAILMNFMLVSAYALDGFADAAETFAGQAVGRRNRNELDQALHLSFEPACLIGLTIGVIYFVFGGIIIDVITTIEAVRDEANRYVIWAAVLPPLSVSAFVLDGVFFGAAAGRDIRNAMFFAVCVFFGTCVITLYFLGNHGLWLALNLMNIARGVLLWRRYRAVAVACTVG